MPMGANHDSTVRSAMSSRSFSLGIPLVTLPRRSLSVPCYAFLPYRNLDFTRPLPCNPDLPSDFRPSSKK